MYIAERLTTCFTKPTQTPNLGAYARKRRAAPLLLPALSAGDYDRTARQTNKTSRRGRQPPKYEVPSNASHKASYRHTLGDTHGGAVLYSFLIPSYLLLLILWVKLLLLLLFLLLVLLVLLQLRLLRFLHMLLRLVVVVMVILVHSHVNPQTASKPTETHSPPPLQHPPAPVPDIDSLEGRSAAPDAVLSPVFSSLSPPSESDAESS